MHPPRDTTGASMHPPRDTFTAAALLLLVATAGCDELARRFLFGASEPRGAAPGRSLDELPETAVRTVATGLDTPWEIRFLPGGDLLVTQRPGILTRLDGSGAVLEEHPIPGVVERGEGGLMGLALHPGYPEPPWIYLCHTGRAESGFAGTGLHNLVVRYRHAGRTLDRRAVLLDRIPGNAFHDGCRLEFGPDGHLYVTTGDAGNPERAQNRASPAGKIHRLTSDGDPAPGNPVGTTVWSWGHRNPQGLAFDAAGRLWSTEHGPSGLDSGQDELNLIEAGGNYGWPAIRGDETRPGMVSPVLHSGGETWAPAGLAVAGGSLFFAGLRGEALFQVTLPERRSGEDPGKEPELVAHFFGDFGRLRAVRVGPDGALYVSTSNRDGRGRLREGDDRILRVDPAVLGRAPHR